LKVAVFPERKCIPTVLDNGKIRGKAKLYCFALYHFTPSTEQGMCPMCNKEEGWSHILRYAETRSWRKELEDKRFTNIEPETGMRRIATIKDNDKVQEVGLYLSKYKEKWKRSVMNYEEE
jgi:hypothetical protein